MAKEEEPTQQFTTVLGQLDEGGLNHELTTKLRGLTGELADYATLNRRAGKGALTLTLNVVALENGTIGIVGDVKTKTPKPVRAGTVFWRTKGQNLSLDNPKQQRLPIQDVAPAPRGRDIEPTDRPTRSI